MKTTTRFTAVIVLFALASTAGAQDTIRKRFDSLRVRHTVDGRSVDLFTFTDLGGGTYDLQRVASFTDAADDRFVIVGDNDSVLVGVKADDLDRVIATLSATGGQGSLHVTRGGDGNAWYLQRDPPPAPEPESGPCRRPSVAAVPGDT